MKKYLQICNKIKLIQTTKLSWAKEIDNKLVDLDKIYKRNDLMINKIKEGKKQNLGRIWGCKKCGECKLLTGRVIEHRL